MDKLQFDQIMVLGENSSFFIWAPLICVKNFYPIDPVDVEKFDRIKVNSDVLAGEDDKSEEMQKLLRLIP